MACLCTRATNLQKASQVIGYRYIDCDGQLQYYPPLDPDETGPKICVTAWLPTGLPAGTFEYFGECIDGECSTTVPYTFYSCDSDIPPFCVELSPETIIEIDELQTNCFEVQTEAFTGAFIGFPSYEGCAEPIIATVTPTSVLNCKCQVQCYTISGGTITYVDSLGDLTLQVGPAEICSRTYPYVESVDPVEIVLNGFCQDDDTCTPYCFLLTDCQGIEDSITSTTQELVYYYISGESIKINGYDTCWTVGLSDACPCAIDVTITEYYADCEACITPVAYKVTDCSNAAIIKYTTDDLSTYVGKVVELDCGGCWTVELINIIPPSDVAITILYTYDTCDSCNQEYWRLVDCAEVENDIVTITDLSVYDGQVITLTWCPTICWTVESTRVVTDATIVFVDGEYETCQDCITAVNPCLCSTVTAPDIAKPAAYGYIDCDGNQQFTDILFPGQTSEKVCARTWNTLSGNITYYGACDALISRDGNIYTCPVVPLPKRSVTPGYNTPACTVEYFDKVSCNFANVMYSITLEERYGITSCCAEDLEKWQIKYELLMMAAMLDPDYVCTPSSTCCEPGLPKSTGTCNS
jgi:hypothetical protein